MTNYKRCGDKQYEITSNFILTEKKAGEDEKPKVNPVELNKWAGEDEDDDIKVSGATKP